MRCRITSESIGRLCLSRPLLEQGPRQPEASVVAGVRRQIDPSALSTDRSSSKVLGLILALVCSMMSGCQSVGRKQLVPPDHVRLLHSDLHCRNADKEGAAASPFVNADQVESAIFGASVLLSLYGSEWEWNARQLAVERDADLSLIRPCDGEGSFKFAQIEVWRTRGFIPPTLQDKPRPESGTLMAPSGATYGMRLQNIFECFEQARVTSGPITIENKQRLHEFDATNLFTSGPYFPGYARIDRYYRPTVTGELSLTGILLYRAQADWAAGIYRELSPKEKMPFAERYLICLLDRGYSW